MKYVIRDVQKRIVSNGGKLPVVDLGVLAIEHGLGFRFLAEMLEDYHVIPCGTYELISRDLSDTEIMKAAEQKMHPTGRECPVCQDGRLDGEPCPICDSGLRPPIG